MLHFVCIKLLSFQPNLKIFKRIIVAKFLRKMSDQKSSLKSKLFLSTEDKDKVALERNKADYELSEEAQVNLPNYSPEVVLNSFTERNENMNGRFFAKTWKKMKRNIIGQTMWIAIIYLFFYYLVQILFVQQLVNTSGWFARNVSREGVLTDPACQTDFCKCCKNHKIILNRIT